MHYKPFHIKYNFQNVLEQDENDDTNSSPNYYHNNIKWFFGLDRDDNNFVLSIYLDDTTEKKEEWSAKFDVDLKLGESEVNRNWKAIKHECAYEGVELLNISQQEMSDLVSEHGQLEVQAAIKILEVHGIRENSRTFDETQKEDSDIVFIVEDQKFYLSKWLLSLHSPYFKSMLSGEFKERSQAAIELKEIEPFEFRNFLHMVYGEPYLFDGQVLGVLKLADMFGATAVMARCEDHLVNHSKCLTDKDKFEAACKYGMKELKKKCIDNLENVSDVLTFFEKYEKDLEEGDVRQLMKKACANQKKES